MTRERVVIVRMVEFVRTINAVAVLDIMERDVKRKRPAKVGAIIKEFASVERCVSVSPDIQVIPVRKSHWIFLT